MARSVSPRFVRALFVILFFVLSTGTLAPSNAWARKHAAARSSTKYADIVINAATGRILQATDVNGRRHPASLTKMMTLYLTFQALDAGKITLDQRLPVSSHAAAQAPSKLGLKPGRTIRVQDAIFGLITQSTNDAAVVLAETIGGSESSFATLMTRQAKALGMSQTVFRNASGLPIADQYTSAHDMAILGYALYKHYPTYYPWFSRSAFTYGTITHRNHNHLMERYQGMDGIKTGYIRASGFNLVASAKRGNVRLIAVIFGGTSARSRDNAMAGLLDRAFASVAQEGPLLRADTSGTEPANHDVTDTRYLALPAKPSAPAPSPPPAQNTKDQPAPPVNQAAPPTDNGVADVPAVNWGLQVGAYSDEAIARQSLSDIARSMTKILGPAEPTLQKIVHRDLSILYRARFMGMEEKNARSVCAYMVKRGQNCVVIAPNKTDDTDPSNP